MNCIGVRMCIDWIRFCALLVLVLLHMFWLCAHRQVIVKNYPWTIVERNMCRLHNGHLSIYIHLTLPSLHTFNIKLKIKWFLQTGSVLTVIYKTYFCSNRTKQPPKHVSECGQTQVLYLLLLKHLKTRDKTVFGSDH